VCVVYTLDILQCVLDSVGHIMCMLDICLKCVCVGHAVCVVYTLDILQCVLDSVGHIVCMLDMSKMCVGQSVGRAVSYIRWTYYSVCWTHNVNVGA
jgi:hypothetical protein